MYRSCKNKYIKQAAEKGSLYQLKHRRLTMLLPTNSNGTSVSGQEISLFKSSCLTFLT